MAEKLTVDIIARTLGIKSLVDLKAGLDMIIGTVKQVGAAIKVMTDAYAKQEQEEAKLQAAVGGSITSLKDFASQMQKVTTVGDEDSLMVMRLASSMGVMNSQLPEASKNAISLSKALGMDLSSATKISAAALQGNYDLLTRFSPELKNAKTEAEKMAIVNNLLAKGWKIAEAEANTFGGTLKQIENIQGDMLETGGKLIAVIGKDMVTAYKENISALNDWINESENFNNIANIGKAVFEGLSGIIGQFKENFSNLTKGISVGNKEFDVFGGILKSVASAFIIVANVIKINFKLLGDFINSIKLAGLAALNFWTMLTGSKDAKEQAKKNLEAIGEEYKKMGSGYVDIVKDTVSKVVKTWDGVKDIETTQKNVYDNMIKNTKNEADQEKKIVEEKNKEIEKNTKSLSMALGDIWNTSAGDITDTVANLSSSLVSAYSTMLTTLVDESASASDKISSVFTSLGSLISNVLSGITSMLQSQMEEQIKILEENKDSELASIEEKTAKELELVEYGGMTKEEAREKEIASIKNKLEVETNENERTRLNDRLKTLQMEKAKEKIVLEAEKEKQKTKDEYAKKEHELRVKQFRANQATQVAEVWVNAAVGVASAWAGAASWPGPSVIAGMVIAGVLSALILGLAGAQTGIIMSQSPPALATGTAATPYAGDYLVGEKGAELVNLPAGASVKNAGETRSFLSNMGGNNYYFSIDRLEIKANTPQQLAEQLIELSRMEKGRL